MAPLKFLIGGVWKSSERIKAILNPADDSTVGEACLASARDVDAAIGAAASASPAAAQLASYERSAILRKTAAAIGSRKEEFARIMTRETGKPITSSRSEVDRSILTFEVAAEEATRIGGEVLPLDLASHSRGRFGMVRRFPIGPVGAITPFNFPLNLVAHKVAPAIAAGNPVVLKPSSSGIMTALKLGEVMMECDVPAGLINIIPCSSGEAEQLITDERIKLISFTGSPAVGWPLKARAGKKRVVLELGGNAGVIVDRTAPLEFAIPRIVQGSYGNAGQSCIAVQRIFVHHDLYEACERRFVELTRQVKVGDPMDETTAVGPMITAEAAAQIEGWIQEAVAAGSRVLCGGGRKRAFLEPTVLVNVRTDLNVSCREVFAPVVTLEPFDDFKDAVAKVNASAYGLQAGVFSNDLANVLYAYHTLEVGGVIANDFPTYRIDHMPYGGEKDSGFGREGLRYAIEEMTTLRLLAFNVL